MLNAILSIAGSSHQGHERFSEISRERQCSFMSFSALLCAQSFPVQHWDWDTAAVDQILIEGDRMYLNALESQRIPDTDTLSLIYLPNQARLTVIFKGEHSPQYDYICSHCVSKNSLSIWRTLIPRFLSVTLLLHD